MNLKRDRCDFTELLSTKLIPFMIVKGYHPAYGEGMDRITEKDPTSDHLKTGKHSIGLAQDIDLYDTNWVYLTKTEDHQIFGEYWESLDPRCSWGGRWSDGNHYSFYESKNKKIK